MTETPAQDQTDDRVPRDTAPTTASDGPETEPTPELEGVPAGAPLAGRYALRDPAGAGPTPAELEAPSAPAPPGPGPPAAPAPPPPVSSRRWPVALVAGLVGGLVGALVVAGVVALVDDDGQTVEAADRDRGRDTPAIARAENVQEILESVEPAVVSVRTTGMDLNVFLQPVPTEGAATGFIIGEDGVIVTNNHVVAGVTEIEVVLSDGETQPAVVLGTDSDFDVAVLKIERDGLPTVALGNSDELRVGDDVIAIGNALALPGGPTVTRGIVSAIDRELEDPGGAQLAPLIQTDAAINLGNSGGPLVNAAGEVVGVNTAIIGGAENIGFAIEIDALKPVIEELRTGAVRTRPFLGVRTITVNEDVARQFDLDVDAGAMVVEVVPGSAAELAGIRRGDVVVEIAGADVTSSEDVSRIVRQREPGEEVPIVVVRAGERETVVARLGERGSGG